MSNLVNRLYWTAYLGYHLLGQAKYPFKPLSIIKRDRDKRVRRMVPYAYRCVPYYRETMDRLGLRPSDIKSADDLTKLPLLENDRLRMDPEYFVSKAQPLSSYHYIRTGGSTGTPRSVYHDVSGLFQHKAHLERGRSVITNLLGQRFGYRETRITSGLSISTQLDKFYRSHGFWPSVVGVEHQKLYLSDPAGKNVTLVNEFKPDLIRSYGSYLTNMFAYVQDTGRTFHRPKIVTYDSDGLSDSVRRLILDELKIHVFTVYGAAEAMAIGFDCERHTGIHLNIDLYPVRIVDSTGKTLANGETGDLVVSNLVNRGTILLNYRLGDLAAILPAGCSCGRSLPLLSYPPGRCDDMLQLPSGELLHPQAVRIIFTEEDLWEYQVVQQTITHFSVALVPSEKCNRQVTKDSIAKKFSQTFGEGISVDISYVDSIDRTKAGKFRPIISLAQTSPLNLMPKNGNN